jgi:hypothetical protein
MSSLYHSSHSRRAVSWAADDTLEATRSMLRSASLSAGTVQAYRAAVDRWQDYCTNRSPHTHHPLSHDSGPAELDDCVSIYLAYVYQRRGGRGRQLGVCTIFGLYLYYPSIRRRLVERNAARLGSSSTIGLTPSPDLAVGHSHRSHYGGKPIRTWCHRDARSV